MLVNINKVLLGMISLGKKGIDFGLTKNYKITYKG